MKTMLDYIKKERSINESIIESNHISSQISKIKNNKYREVVLFATGSSAYAATSAYIFMQKVLQVPVSIKEPSLSMNYEQQWYHDTLYIAISQGGHSYATIELVKTLQANDIEIFALTSDLASPIAEVSENVIDIGMGIEEMPYVTAGYTATILVLWLLALEISVNQKNLSKEEKTEYINQLKHVVSLSDQMIKDTDKWYDQHKEDLFDKKRYVFIGYGACYGVALEAENKFTEVLHLPAHGHELEEYMHGPYLGLQKEDALFLIDSNGKLSSRMELLRVFLDKHMDKTYMVTHSDKGEEQDLKYDFTIDEDFSPLILTIPFHLISYYLSQAEGTNLHESYYPDFDKITGSKV